jgi:hypothetical protein
MRVHAFTELAKHIKGAGSVFGILSTFLGVFNSYQELILVVPVLCMY